MRQPEQVHELIKGLLKVKGVKAFQMLEDLGLNQAMLSNMGGRGSMPSADKIAKIAAYFSVTTEYLLGVEPAKGGLDLASINTLEPEAIKALAHSALASLSGLDAAELERLGLVLVGIEKPPKDEKAAELEILGGPLDAALAVERQKRLEALFMALPDEERREFAAEAGRRLFHERR